MRSLLETREIAPQQQSDSSGDAITGFPSESSTPECLKPRTEEEARDMHLLQMMDRRTSKRYVALGKEFALGRTQGRICTDESNPDESSTDSDACGESSGRQKIAKPKSYFEAKERARSRVDMDNFRRQRKFLRDKQRQLLNELEELKDGQNNMLQNQDDMLENQDDMLQNQGQIMQNQALGQAFQRRNFNNLQKSVDVNTHLLRHMARKLNIDPNDAFATANAPRSNQTFRAFQHRWPW